jgi:hypothetical protein
MLLPAAPIIAAVSDEVSNVEPHVAQSAASHGSTGEPVEPYPIGLDYP